MKKLTEPTTAVLLRLAIPLKEAIESLARRHRRTTTEEIRMALENHTRLAPKP